MVREAGTPSARPLPQTPSVPCASAICPAKPAVSADAIDTLEATLGQNVTGSKVGSRVKALASDPTAVWQRYSLGLIFYSASLAQRGALWICKRCRLDGAAGSPACHAGTLSQLQPAAQSTVRCTTLPACLPADSNRQHLPLRTLPCRPRRRGQQVGGEPQPAGCAGGCQRGFPRKRTRRTLRLHPRG